MTNVKCIRCGALNTRMDQNCRICELDLDQLRQPLAQPSPHWNNRSAQPTIIRPFKTVSDAFGPTIHLFTRNFWLITKIVVVIVAPFEIFQTLNIRNLNSDWQLAAGVHILDLMCTVLIAPALTYALMQVLQTGTAPGVNEAYRWGFTKLGKLTLCAAISWTLQFLGLALCIVPGIIIGLSLQLAFPIVILENVSPTQALRRSYDLTKGHRLKILGATLVIWILMFAVSLPVELIAENLALADLTFWPLYAAMAIFADIIQQSPIVLSLVTYLSIHAFWSQTTQ